MRNLLLREARASEIKDISDFYKSISDPHVMLRLEQDVKKAIDDGVFFIVIDLDKNSDNRIVGASAVYTIEVKPEKETTIILKEAGGSLISPEYRGLNLHMLLHWSRSLHEFILDYGGFSEYFGAIICPNHASEKNILKAGFELWETAPNCLIEDRNSYISNRQNDCIKFFKFPTSSLKTHAIGIINHCKTWLVEKRDENGVKQARVNIDTEVIRYYRPILHEIIDKGFEKIIEK